MNWGRYHVETGTAFTWIHSLCVMFMSLNNGDLKNRPESIWTTSRFRSGIGVFCSKFHVHLFNSTFWKSSLFIWEIITNKCPTAWSKLRCSFILLLCEKDLGNFWCKYFWNSVSLCGQGGFSNCCRHGWDLACSLKLNAIATGGRS